MLLTKEFARKRIFNDREVGIEIPSLGTIVRHHAASFVLPNSYPHDGIFNMHLTAIKVSYDTL